jgi:hypothetical protein
MQMVSSSFLISSGDMQRLLLGDVRVRRKAVRALTEFDLVASSLIELNVNEGFK